jgi:hypothetical protein
LAGLKNTLLRAMINDNDPNQRETSGPPGPPDLQRYG